MDLIPKLDAVTWLSAVLLEELPIKNEDTSPVPRRSELREDRLGDVFLFHLFGDEPLSELECRGIDGGKTFLSDDAPVLRYRTFAFEDTFDGLFHAVETRRYPADLREVGSTAELYEKVKDLLHMDHLVTSLFGSPGSKAVPPLTLSPGGDRFVFVKGKEFITDLLTEHLFDVVRYELGLLGLTGGLGREFRTGVPLRSFSGCFLDAFRRLVLDLDCSVCGLLSQKFRKFTVHEPVWPPIGMSWFDALV